MPRDSKDILKKIEEIVSPMSDISFLWEPNHLCIKLNWHEPSYNLLQGIDVCRCVRELSTITLRPIRAQYRNRLHESMREAQWRGVAAEKIQSMIVNMEEGTTKRLELLDLLEELNESLNVEEGRPLLTCK